MLITHDIWTFDKENLTLLQVKLSSRYYFSEELTSSRFLFVSTDSIIMWSPATRGMNLSDFLRCFISQLTPEVNLRSDRDLMGQGAPGVAKLKQEEAFEGRKEDIRSSSKEWRNGGSFVSLSFFWENKRKCTWEVNSSNRYYLWVTIERQDDRWMRSSDY